MTAEERKETGLDREKFIKTNNRNKSRCTIFLKSLIFGQIGKEKLKNDALILNKEIEK